MSLLITSYPPPSYSLASDTIVNDVNNHECIIFISEFPDDMKQKVISGSDQEIAEALDNSGQLQSNNPDLLQQQTGWGCKGMAPTLNLKK